MGNPNSLYEIFKREIHRMETNPQYKDMNVRMSYDEEKGWLQYIRPQGVTTVMFDIDKDRTAEPKKVYFQFNYDNFPVGSVYEQYYDAFDRVYIDQITPPLEEGEEQYGIHVCDIFPWTDDGPAGEWICVGIKHPTQFAIDIAGDWCFNRYSDKMMVKVDKSATKKGPYIPRD